MVVKWFSKTKNPSILEGPIFILEGLICRDAILSVSQLRTARAAPRADAAFLQFVFLNFPI